MTETPQAFGQLLQQTRQAQRLSRLDLARLVDLDPSHIYRMEKGERKPGRDTVLALAEALGVPPDSTSRWLVLAGYEALPVLAIVRRSARRGRNWKRSQPRSATSDFGDGARWAALLEGAGLQGDRLERLLRGFDEANFGLRTSTADALTRGIERATATLESPIRTAVIPAAGGLHRLLAAHVMQRLLLRGIGEALAAGISDIVLVLAPGSVDALETPLAEAMALSIIPTIRLRSVEQERPAGLGDAVLRASDAVGNEPFALLLPDDVTTERRQSRQGGLLGLADARRAFRQPAHIVATVGATRSRLRESGVAQLAETPGEQNLFAVLRLVERPASNDAILDGSRVVRIAGRYVLESSIFEALRSLRADGADDLDLTSALEKERTSGKLVLAREAAPFEDMGQVIERASDLLNSPR
jgi:UTP--glucose-1-phosphate uridylyltransferase